jgi:hypothetical protein
MTAWHTVHLLLLFVLLLFVLMRRLPTEIENRLWRVQSISRFALAAWLLVFGVLHFI